MSLLLDTHALIWWFLDSPRLSDRARSAIVDYSDPVYVSAVSAFEIATKVRLGKLPDAARLDRSFDAFVEAQHFKPLPLTLEHALVAGGLSDGHKDPFDRLLIAQALTENLTLVSNERLFDGFGVRRLW
ncbi:MAG: type II toxin-antitoxin system VapC family toxin [Caulobacter sp.]|nr:type II toxin-antitoxin system VapC family toxin [Caulobacter sp.]